MLIVWLVGCPTSEETEVADTEPPADTEPDTDTTDTDTLPDRGVCTRWAEDRQFRNGGVWTGSVASCNAGTWEAPGPDNTLRQVNLYRWLADLPAVTHDATRDSGAQQCALMMHANGDLDHDPPTSWDCYTAAGAGAAGNSNISSTTGVSAIDQYMQDSGNGTTFGHRRWIISDGLGPIGIGSTNATSCLWVIGGNGSDHRAWTAWPPPGGVPLEAVEQAYLGWTLQSDTIALDNATVTITHEGADQPSQLTHLLPYYGSEYAIAFAPQFNAEAGRYHVEVSGTSPAIAYDVDVLECP